MQLPYNPTEITKIPNAKIAILQGAWHRQYTDRMVVYCEELLKKAEVSSIEKFIVPGSLELPIVAKSLLERTSIKLDAIICIAGLLKGDTYHFEMVLNNSSRGLADLSLQFSTPIINEVLPCVNFEQLEKRSADNEYNKGIEAAQACASSVALLRQIRSGN